VLGSACATAGEARVQLAALSGEYTKTLFLNEEAAGGQREVQQGDDLVILAAHILRDEAGRAAAAVEGDEGDGEFGSGGLVVMLMAIERTSNESFDLSTSVH
jgi:hypothetical protein